MITIDNRRLLILDDELLVKPNSVVVFKDDCTDNDKYTLYVDGLRVELSKEITDGCALLTWRVLSEHLPDNGVLKCQIKIEKGEVCYFTEVVCFLRDNSEFGDNLTNNMYYQMGHKAGYKEGLDGEDYKRGYEEGHAQGLKDGQEDGYKNGYKEGQEDGHKSGYETGKQDGLKEGYDNGYTQGKADGYKDGYNEGYSKGYSEGYEKGKAEGDDFIGIKYLEVEQASYRLPIIVDARSLQIQTESPDANLNLSFFASLFNNASINGNGGQYVKMQEVYLPDHIKYLSTSMFYNCGNLTTIHADLSECEQIGVNTFRSCTSLTQIPYMPNLEIINNGSFWGCTGLVSVNLYKTLTTFNATAFQGCTNLLDIYVPWAEGEVANAPWGATNATIHYNTQFDENHNPIISEV